MHDGSDLRPLVERKRRVELEPARAGYALLAARAST